MPALPTTTPQRTLSLKSFVAYLQDGRVIQVLTDGGEGFFREQVYKGSEKSFVTFECFVTNGRMKILTIFGGGEMSDEPVVPEEEEPDEESEDE